MDEMNVVQMSCLGRMGRFGNQLFQYAFARQHATEALVDLQTSPWVGNEIFKIERTPITNPMPIHHERYMIDGDACSDPIKPKCAEYVRRDAYGYFQLHTKWFDRRWWQKTYHAKHSGVPVRPVDRGGVVGIHYRAGDFNNRGLFWRPPISWYMDCLRKLWISGHYSRLIVVSEDKTIYRCFAQFDPWTPERMEIRYGPAYQHYNYEPGEREQNEPSVVDFYAEWSLLAKCDVLIIPNSTFSFTAAMSNTRLRRCFRASLGARSFIEINPWDANPLDRRKAEDYEGALR